MNGESIPLSFYTIEDKIRKKGEIFDMVTNLKPGLLGDMMAHNYSFESEVLSFLNKIYYGLMGNQWRLLKQVYKRNHVNKVRLK